MGMRGRVHITCVLSCTHTGLQICPAFITTNASSDESFAFLYIRTHCPIPPQPITLVSMVLTTTKGLHRGMVFTIKTRRLYDKSHSQTQAAESLRTTNYKRLVAEIVLVFPGTVNAKALSGTRLLESQKTNANVGASRCTQMTLCPVLSNYVHHSSQCAFSKSQLSYCVLKRKGSTTPIKTYNT